MSCSVLAARAERLARSGNARPAVVKPLVCRVDMNQVDVTSARRSDNSLFERDKVVPDTWLRRRQVTTWIARYFRALAVFSVLVAACFLIIGPTSANHDAQTVGLAFAASFVVYAAFCEALARCYANRGLFVSADGIVVRNLFSTRRIGLHDAERFAPGVPAGLNGPCPMLMCRTGPAVGVGGLGVAALRWRYGAALGDLEPLCNLLNELLDGLRADPQPPV
jgi:hypothetical protein